MLGVMPALMHMQGSKHGLSGCADINLKMQMAGRNEAGAAAAALWRSPYSPF